jgi:hypothetical protein
MSTPALPNGTTAPSRRVPTAGVAVVVIVAAAAFLIGRQGWEGPSLSFTNGVNGSGVAASQIRTLPSFSAVDLAGVSNITVHVGAMQTVVVRADDNLINSVKTDVRDGVLVVSERGDFSNKLPLRVDVIVPSLDSARLMGSGTINVTGVDARRFTAQLPGSGTLTISGQTRQLDAAIAGSGTMQLGGLVARSVTASVPGSGRLEVHATRTLDASIPGSGQIIYSGHPKNIEQIINGSGAIRRR